MAVERLGVWMDDVHVADLERRRWNEIRCRYTHEALSRHPQNAPVLSCSLPLSPNPLDAMAFCRGLLPEGRALQALSARAEMPTNDTFGLLSRYGKDVAGALVITADPPRETAFGVEPYTSTSLEQAIDDMDEHPLGVHDDSELSLAGLQDKLLLVDLGDGRWGRPLHGCPSTHILKVDDARHPGLVEAESQCLGLAGACGLTTVDAELTSIGDVPCLIISRFDRVEHAGGVRRLHQEDVCQALGLDPEARRGRGKYEASGGPSFAQVAELLDVYAVDPSAELDRLVAVMTFTVLIGNADGHGKNLALLHPSAEHIVLAPLYDTVPTALWPKLRSDAAMSIGGHWPMGTITVDHIVREAAAWPHPAERARAVADATISAVHDALSDVVPAGAPLADYVSDRARQLA